MFDPEIHSGQFKNIFHDINPAMSWTKKWSRDKILLKFGKNEKFEKVKNFSPHVICD